MLSTRVCASFLIAGLVVFMVGAVFWRAAYQSPSHAEALRAVGEEPGRWLWIHVWIAVGVVLTTSGLSSWTAIQGNAGERAFTPIGFTLYLIGAVLWMVAIGLRVTVQDWAASEVVAGHAVPTAYLPLHRLAGLLYAAHMVLSYLSAIALGAGVLNSQLLSSRLGWAGIIGGALFAAGFVIARGGPFGPPFMAHLYSFALGVALLRLR